MMRRFAWIVLAYAFIAALMLWAFYIATNPRSH